MMAAIGVFASGASEARTRYSAQLLLPGLATTLVRFKSHAEVWGRRRLTTRTDRELVLSLVWNIAFSRRFAPVPGLCGVCSSVPPVAKKACRQTIFQNRTC
jgi:hypothetical protein